MIVFDIVQRWLRASGYPLTYVRNITDIDDKIIRRASETGESVAALTEREGLLLRWMTFFQQWPLVILPTLADLPPRQVADIEPGGQKKILESMRPALLAPLLGLPGLAVPVGSHGKLRTGVQIMAMRNREDLCLDAGEVIEAAEGVVTPIDPQR